MTSQIETIRKFGLTDKLDQLYANTKMGTTQNEYTRTLCQNQTC